MPVFECRHILTSGAKCNALALTGSCFCWFHNRTRRQAASAETMAMPALEDHESVQLALSDVLARIADGRMSPKSAGILLYGLQIASNNLRNTHLHRANYNTVTEPVFDPVAGELGPLYLADPEHQPRLPKSLKKATPDTSQTANKTTCAILEGAANH